jgi:TRAP-type C4-dicarboxylate transport system substrate-binding protein
MGMDKFLKVIAKRTDGKFVIKANYGSPLGPRKENLDSLKAGAFQAAVVVPGWTPHKLPLWQCTGLSFATEMSDEYVQAQCIMRGYKEFAALRKELDRWNVVLIYPMISTPNTLIGKMPIRKVEDFKGVRIRTLGMWTDSVKALGGTPIGISPPEIFEAMDKGVLDLSTMGLAAQVAYGLHEIAKYFMISPVGQTPSILVANKDAYNALPDAYKKVLAEEWEDVVLWHRKDIDRDDAEALKKARKAGVEIIKWSDKELARMVAIGGRPIWNKWAADREKEGLPGKAALDYMLKTAEEAQKALKKKLAGK